MIDLVTAGIIAKLASDAVGAIDKMFRGYADFVKKREPSETDVPPHDFTFANSPGQNAIVAQTPTGEARQTVTYPQLSERLNKGDLDYIEALSQAMENYQRQWNAAYKQRSMASGMEIGKLDAQLDYLAKEISDPLIRVLGFVEKMGLQLDDHYLAARDLAKEYVAR